VSDTVPKDYVLYRFFDVDGGLLYIGKSVKAWARFTQHARDSKFYPEAAKIEMKRGFADDAELSNAEIAAIRAEHPRYNIAHNNTGIIPVPAPPPSREPITSNPNWQIGKWNPVRLQRPWDELSLLTGEVVRIYEDDQLIVQGIVDDSWTGCIERLETGECECCPPEEEDSDEPPDDPDCFLSIIGEDFRGPSFERGWFTVELTSIELYEQYSVVYTWVSNDGDDEITQRARATVTETFKDMEVAAQFRLKLAEQSADE
jgi:hypothetical protein